MRIAVNQLNMVSAENATNESFSDSLWSAAVQYYIVVE